MGRHLAAAAGAHGCGADVPCGTLLALLAIGAGSCGARWCACMYAWVALRDLVQQEHNPLRYRERPSGALDAGHPAHMKCPSTGHP